MNIWKILENNYNEVTYSLDQLSTTVQDVTRIRSEKEQIFLKMDIFSLLSFPIRQIEVISA